MKLMLPLLFLFAMLAPGTTHAQQKSVLSEPIESLSKSSVDDRRGTLVFEDRFERNESQETKDEPGNGWKTNSQARAGGNKQVDLVDGALRIYRHDVADHGVSVVHDAEFQNGSVEIKFLLEDDKDSLGLDFADLKFKEVHAGHLFKVVIGTKYVEIADLKTGVMDLKTRELRQSKQLTKDQTAHLKTKSKRFPNKLKTGQWYSAVAKIAGETLSVSIDGVPVGSFSSEGIAHPTKRTLRLAISKNVVVDDLKVFSRSDEGVPSGAALKVLLVAGGCCHDYGTQTQILKDGIESRIHADVTVIYNEATGTGAKFEIYESDDWAQGYDVVLHDECCASVAEEPYVQRILAAHKNGVPAVNLHCAMHSYRWGDFRNPVEPGSPNSGWYEMIGIQSTGHGPKAPIDVSYVESKSPITGGMSAWKTIDEELYNNIRMFSGVEVLATGKQTQMPNKNKLKKNPNAKPTVSEAVVIWTNEFGPKKTKIFSTSLGHFNDTVKDERYMELVVRGLLWTTGNITADGKPTKGFAFKK